MFKTANIHCSVRERFFAEFESQKRSITFFSIKIAFKFDLRILQKQKGKGLQSFQSSYSYQLPDRIRKHPYVVGSTPLNNSFSFVVVDVHTDINEVNNAKNDTKLTIRVPNDVILINPLYTLNAWQN